MTDSLAIAVNRNGLHTLDVPGEFETDGPFVVELHNHGEPAHVHLNLDDRLSRVARLKATNHYVDSGESRTIEIETRDPTAWPGGSVQGTLKVVIGHGQETHHVNVTLDRAATEGVRVDPTLSQPGSKSGAETPPLLRVLPVVVLGSVAMLLAVGSIFATDGVDLVIGGLALVAAGLCAASAYYLLS